MDNLEEIAIAETNDARYIRDRILREKRKIDRLRNSIQIYQVPLLIVSTVYIKHSNSRVKNN